MRSLRAFAADPRIYTNDTGWAGAAITTWNYDQYRGWLSNKRYQDDTGPDYTYTPAGRLRTRTWAGGVTATYTNNTAGLLQGITYSDSTPSVAFTYDYLGRTKTITQGGSNVFTLTYNSAGQVVSETYTGGPLNGLTVSNRFNDLQQRIAVSVLGIPGGTVETGYEYENGRLKTVTSGTNSATYSYWPNSSLLSNVVFRNGTAERMTTSRQFDGLNRLTAISSVPSASSAISFAYAYNAANQRTAVTNADNARWEYGYDRLGQVTNATRRWADDSLVAGQQFAFDFDDIGNRRSSIRDGREAFYSANLLNQYSSRVNPGYVNILGEAATNATVKVNAQEAERKGGYYRKEVSVDNTAGPVWQGITNLAILTYATNEIYTVNTGRVLVPVAGESLAYDANGNLTNDSLWQYTWDAENRLIRAESAAGVPVTAKARVEWVFDSLGRRIGETTYTWNTNSSAYVLSTNLCFVYDGWQLLAELNTAHSLRKSFSWGLDLSGTLTGAGGVGGLLMAVFTNSAQFYAYDGNGNVSALINATDGTESARYEYEPFGAKLRATGLMAQENPFQFSTKRLDLRTGLVLYEYRALSTDHQRWLSRDLIGERGWVNLHGFVRNNAIGEFDPLGLVTYTVTDDMLVLSPPILPQKRILGAGAFGAQIEIGKIKIDHLYAKAVIEESIRSEDTKLDDFLNENLNISNLNISKYRQINYLGAGFAAEFIPSEKCYCKKIKWRQEKLKWYAWPWWSPAEPSHDYTANGNKAIDFPGGVVRFPGLNYNYGATYYLHLYCDNIEVYSIVWSYDVTYNADFRRVNNWQKEGSATVTLDISNW